MPKPIAEAKMDLHKDIKKRTGSITRPFHLEFAKYFGFDKLDREVARLNSKVPKDALLTAGVLVQRNHGKAGLNAKSAGSVGMVLEALRKGESPEQITATLDALHGNGIKLSQINYNILAHGSKKQKLDESLTKSGEDEEHVFGEYAPGSRGRDECYADSNHRRFRHEPGMISSMERDRNYVEALAAQHEFMHPKEVIEAWRAHGQNNVHNASELILRYAPKDGQGHTIYDLKDTAKSNDMHGPKHTQEVMEALAKHGLPAESFYYVSEIARAVKRNKPGERYSKASILQAFKGAIERAESPKPEGTFIDPEPAQSGRGPRKRAFDRWGHHGKYR